MKILKFLGFFHSSFYLSFTLWVCEDPAVVVEGKIGLWNSGGWLHLHLPTRLTGWLL